jgi:cytochrome c-type biogenesis protein CcmH
MIFRPLLALAMLVFATGIATAVEPSEMLKDPALEGRARAISQEIRCLVCQNQSIDDSAADLAHDLRLIVRERLSAGDNDQQVKDYLTARYGDFVLLDPPVKTKTLILWAGPAALLLLGIVIIALAARRRRAVPATPLNEDERRRLAQLMDQPR